MCSISYQLRFLQILDLTNLVQDCIDSDRQSIDSDNQRIDLQVLLIVRSDIPVEMGDNILREALSPLSTSP